MKTSSSGHRARRLAALLLVAVGVITIFLWDGRKRVAHQEDLMVVHGQAIADIVAESSIHNLGTYNQWENKSTAG